ncbi:sensor histidine kinase [Actinomadura latina]|uniref:Signal transduction histidine-protein kinase/phosphatase MprB n=1 Tax=Actinomadura latina TaxID=163603 RepID=A0A846YNR4_9ACTN|nr:HAMP domain-containing sensor histidine kinase [Actinomadura latina]NKZ02380.1 HAMP domain-containing histidine kinase [Actinomadura latina]
MRRHITLLVAATVVLVLVAFLVPLALLVRDVARTRTLAAANVRAQSLAPVVAAGDRGTVELALQQTASTGHPMTVLWPDGRVSGSPAVRDPGVRLAERGQSLTVDTPGGREILVAVLGVPGGTAVIRTSVSDRQMRAGVTRAWGILAALSCGLLAVSLVLADRLARSLVRRIALLADLARRVSHGDLDVRVAPGGPPEIRDVTAGLNDLAGQIGELLAREREAAADLSHRLRTPLTVLRLEAETLSDPAEAERIGDQVGVLERTVTDLINTTRRPARTEAPCADAAAIVTERVEFWSALADEQQRRVDLDVPPGPLPVKVRAEDLSACLDALLGNVFSHTPEGSALAVALQPRSGAVYLTVDDAGPGFGERHLLRRGVSTASSTGLGLDIVRRTAEASGGSLQLGVSPAEGARVMVRFGVPPRGRAS